MQPSAAAQPGGDLPAVYGGRFRPDRLSPAQCDEIRGIVARAAQPSPLWFVYVRDNRPKSTESTIYFRPTVCERRICRGMFTVYAKSALFEQFQNAMRRTSHPATAPQGEPPIQIGEYVWVAPPEFKQTDLPRRPELTDLPFVTLGPLADGDIVDLVDAYRARGKRLVNGTNIGGIDSRLPIISLLSNDGETFYLRTGTVEGPLSGGGQELTIVRASDRWLVQRAGPWGR